MKKLINIAIGLVAVLLFACTPEVELRDQPAALPGVEFSVDDTDPNQPILTINDESVFNVNWIFDDGSMLQGTSVKCFYPLKGDYAFTIVAMNGKGQSEGTGSVNVPISNPDMVYGIPEYVALCGKKEDNGKYWVWDQEEPGGNVSYMTASYDWEEFWWNPYNEGDGTAADLPGLLNEIKFDLDGGFNFTRFETKDGVEENGSFQLNLEAMTLTINNAHIPNYNDPNIDPDIAETGAYKIQVINDYELLLWQDHPTKGYAWAWKFKARDLIPTDDPVYKLCFDTDGSPKTWEFNHSGSYGACYMTDAANWEGPWWNPYSSDVTTLPDYDNSIQFEKNGTYTRYAADGSEIESGTYKFERSESSITFDGAYLPNYNEPNIDPNVVATNKYSVKIIEQDELFIWQDHSPENGGEFNYGWAWIFMPKQ